MFDQLKNESIDDGVDRRGFLECMAWAGTGLLWTLNGGLPAGRVFGQDARRAGPNDFSFVQISDSHIGFGKEPNKDVVGTLRAAVAKINALPQPPAFVLHTGDLTHLAKAEEFDTVAEVLKALKTRVFYVPGEHDFESDDNKLYLERYGRGTMGTGWYSFDYNGAHFVGLVNVANAKSGSMNGLGQLGKEQLQWLSKDLANVSNSKPIVVFAHVPLWAVYEKWGWGTKDAEQALTLLKRFGSVTILNGHIHQIMQKVEGRVVFHAARSTAFPQSEPGKGSPGPIRDFPADRLRGALGVTTVGYVENRGHLAVADPTLES
ncbi:MAG TPA: metallophosphoesterase [Pirellulales bacterium]|jgi:Icc protein|nr:metallophosphoesterase [Pirellulales bacterium]